MTTRAAWLLPPLQKLVRRLEGDLRERATEVPEVTAWLRGEYAAAKAAARTGEAFEVFQEEVLRRRRWPGWWRRFLCAPPKNVSSSTPAPNASATAASSSAEPAGTTCKKPRPSPAPTSASTKAKPPSPQELLPLLEGLEELIPSSANGTTKSTPTSESASATTSEPSRESRPKTSTSNGETPLRSRYCAGGCFLNSRFPLRSSFLRSPSFVSISNFSPFAKPPNSSSISSLLSR